MSVITDIPLKNRDGSVIAKVLVKDHDELEKYLSNGSTFGTISKMYPITEKEEIESSLGFITLNDDRDSTILSVLTDDYEIRLYVEDIHIFVEAVENKIIFCDLNDPINSGTSMIVDIHKEKEKYTEEFIEKNLDGDYSFLRLSTLSCLPLNIFEKYPDKFNWTKISWLELDIEYMKRNRDKLDWDVLSTSDADDDFVDEFQSKLSFNGRLGNLPEYAYSQSTIIRAKRNEKINNILND